MYINYCLFTIENTFEFLLELFKIYLHIDKASLSEEPKFSIRKVVTLGSPLKQVKVMLNGKRVKLRSSQ